MAQKCVETDQAVICLLCDALTEMKKKMGGELLVLSYRTTVTVKDGVQAGTPNVRICIYAVFKKSHYVG